MCFCCAQLLFSECLRIFRALALFRFFFVPLSSHRDSIQSVSLGVSSSVFLSKPFVSYSLCSSCVFFLFHCRVLVLECRHLRVWFQHASSVCSPGLFYCLFPFISVLISHAIALNLILPVHDSTIVAHVVFRHHSFSFIPMDTLSTSMRPDQLLLHL